MFYRGSTQEYRLPYRNRHYRQLPCSQLRLDNADRVQVKRKSLLHVGNVAYCIKRYVQKTNADRVKMKQVEILPVDGHTTRK